MKLLITGVCGFVGNYLARYFRERFVEWEIHGLDNFIRPGSEANRLGLKKLGVKVWHADLRAASDFDTLPPVDAVIDAAANPSVLAGMDGRTSSRQLLEHNLIGTINLLEYCKTSHSRLVLLSTSRVYSIEKLSAIPVQISDGGFVPDDSQLPPGVTKRGLSEAFSTVAPVSLYGATKLASEALALEYGAAFEFPVWINRCGVLAGAGQFGRPDQGIFAYWLHCWKQNVPLRYMGFGGMGHQVRDCLHPEDLGNLISLQLTCYKKRDPLINVSGGTDRSMSLRQLSTWCGERWGMRNVAADSTSRPFDLPWVIMDSTKAQDVWGWTPKRSLESILEEIARHAEIHPDWLELSSA